MAFRIFLAAMLRLPTLLSGLLIIFASFQGLAAGDSAHDVQLDSLLESYESARNKENKFQTVIQIIDHLADQEDWEQALVYGRLGMQLAEDMDARILLPEVYERLADIYYYLEFYSLAADFSEKAIEILKEEGDRRRLADAYDAYSLELDALGKNPEALEASLSAAEIYEEIGDKESLAHTFNDIGVIQYYMGKNDLALSYYEKAYTIFQEIGFEGGMAICYTNIANILSEQGDYEKGLEMYFKGLEYDLEVNDPKGIIISKGNIGETYTEMGEYQKAEEFLADALKRAEDHGDQWLLTNPLRGLAGLYRAQGDIDKALGYAKQSLKVALSIKAKAEIIESYYIISEIEKDAGNYKTALHYWELYARLKDSLLDESSNHIMLEMEARFRAQEQMKEIELLKKEQEIDELKDREAAMKHEEELREEKNKQVFLWSALGVFLIILVLALVGFRAIRKANRKLADQNETIRKAQEDLKNAFEQIEETNKDITDSIRYAKQIQEAIMPDESNIANVLPDAFVFFRPRDIVSGDFYWVHERENEVYFSVADCTGHGVPGAFVSMLCTNLFNQVVIDKGERDPGKILTEVNSRLIAALNKSDKRSSDGMDVTFCRLDKATRQLTVACAMNGAFIAGKEEHYVVTDKTPIGGHTEMGHSFSSEVVQLEQGDHVFLYSDGFQDQFGGEKGKKYKSGNFRKLLSRLKEKPTTQMSKVLEEELTAWKGELEQLDDICVLGLRIS